MTQSEATNVKGNVFGTAFALTDDFAALLQDKAPRPLPVNAPRISSVLPSGNENARVDVLQVSPAGTTTVSPFKRLLKGGDPVVVSRVLIYRDRLCAGCRPPQRGATVAALPPGRTEKRQSCAGNLFSAYNLGVTTFAAGSLTGD